MLHRPEGEPLLLPGQSHRVNRPPAHFGFVKLPAGPFAGVKVKAPGAQRYRSEINPEWLLTCLGEELRESYPQQYLAMFLRLWGGLCCKEASLLTWEQIDFARDQFHVRGIIYFEPKTEEAPAPSIERPKRSMDLGHSRTVAIEFYRAVYLRRSSWR